MARTLYRENEILARVDPAFSPGTNPFPVTTDERRETDFLRDMALPGGGDYELSYTLSIRRPARH